MTSLFYIKVSSFLPKVKYMNMKKFYLLAESFYKNKGFKPFFYKKTNV